MEIGEKTNVYSVEVSMHGYEEVSPDPAIETKIIPYSEEDCKFKLVHFDYTLIYVMCNVLQIHYTVGA